MGHPVMYYHKSEGEPLEAHPARWKIFDSDALPDKRSGWRETPAEAVKVRARGRNSTRFD